MTEERTRDATTIEATGTVPRYTITLWNIFGEVAKRRQEAEAGEAVAVRERRAQAVCLRQGRHIPPHGFGLLG